MCPILKRESLTFEGTTKNNIYPRRSKSLKFGERFQVLSWNQMNRDAWIPHEARHPKNDMLETGLIFFTMTRITPYSYKRWVKGKQAQFLTLIILTAKITTPAKSKKMKRKTTGLCCGNTSLSCQGIQIITSLPRINTRMFK